MMKETEDIINEAEAEATSKMNPELAMAESVFKKMDWSYTSNYDAGLLSTHFSSDIYGTLHTDIRQAKGNGLICLTQMPVSIPMDKMPAVQHYINRVNFVKLYGAFIINDEDGSLIFQISNSFGEKADVENYFEFLGFMITVGSNTIDDIGPDINKIINGDDDIDVDELFDDYMKR